MRTKSLVLFLFLFCGLLSAADLSPVVSRALELKKNAETANEKDIAHLWDRFQGKFQKLSAEEQDALLKNLRARLTRDKATFREMRKILLEKKEGTYELRTSLVKLIGVEDAEGKVLYSGILDDAQKLISGPKEKNILYANLADIRVERNEITVLKTLLIYGNVLLEEKLEEIEKKVQLLYPTPCPSSTSELAASCALSCDGNLLIPNAGYVFGGNFVGTQCRGIDCSAFVSDCAKSRERMSTLYLDFLWREIKFGEKGFEAKELAIRKELIEKYQLLESKADFELIEIGGKLEQGDLITWRDLKGAGGHTAIYLAPVPHVPNEFVAIEANREDNKSKEGIEVNTLKLVKKNVRTTILRRRERAASK